MKNDYPGQNEYEIIGAFLDGELDESDRLEVSRRIQSDPTWEQIYRQMESLDNLLGTYQVPAASDNLSNRIICRFQSSSTGHKE